MAVKSGWLYKSPPKLNTKLFSWKRRHFDLFDNGDLAYSKSSSPNDEVLGLIRLSEVEQIADAEETVSFLYSIGLYHPASKRTFYLRGESEADIDSWCKAIQRHVPAYKDLAVDARPVYKLLPEKVIENLPTRAGMLTTQHLEYFSRAKHCEIKEGKFRIYNSQHRDQLHLSYSLLPCKGVQDLSDGSRGKSSVFQFRIEFINQHIEPLVLGAKSPFDRQGWIVCLMKTITILCKHQGSIQTPVGTAPRPRSISVPPEFTELPREHLEEQLTQLLGELDVRDNWVTQLRDDQLMLNTRMNSLRNENERLRRCVTSTSDRIRGAPHPDLGPSPLLDTHRSRMVFLRPTTLPQKMNGNESSSSSSSVESNDIKESLHTQLIGLSRELGCFEGDEYVDHVSNLRQYIFKQNRDSDALIQEREEHIHTLKNQLLERNQTIDGLKLQHVVELNQSMEALNDRHNTELKGCEEKLQTLIAQHTCQVEAIEKEMKQLCEDIVQVKERERELTEERDRNRKESDMKEKTMSEEIDHLKALLQEKETLLLTAMSGPPPKPPLPPKKGSH